MAHNLPINSPIKLLNDPYYYSMKWLDIKKIASRLRKNPTYSESVLWDELRDRKLKGRKFLRQHPILYDTNRLRNDFFFFIPDFYCATEKLVIELDGPIHDYQEEKDHQRDLILNRYGLKVIRIKNEDLIEMDNVLISIQQSFITE
jgi:very-short-patch-repair endonuclease